jgi:hypothetical protein
MEPRFACRFGDAEEGAMVMPLGMLHAEAHTESTTTPNGVSILQWFSNQEKNSHPKALNRNPCGGDMT